MRIAEVIGTVTLNRCHPTFVGATLKLAIPLSLTELRTGQAAKADTLVVWDDLGAGMGCRMAISEGAEAAQPFKPKVKPVDCYNAAILDAVDVGET